MKHTKGPWRVVSDYSREFPLILNEDRSPICQISSAQNTRLGNANLISAAPQLLEALIELVDATAVLGTNSKYPLDAQKRLCDAINKAKGV